MKRWVISLLLIIICLVGVMLTKNFLSMPTGRDAQNITDGRSSYNADMEIAQALTQLKNSQEKAGVITRDSRQQQQIALTFDGLTDRTTIQQILDLLAKYQAKATFFVDGMQAAEDPQTVVNIKKAGHKIENYTLVGLPHMETLPIERVVTDFCRAQKIIKVTTDQGPNLLKCNETVYTDQLLQVAKAAGFSSVVKSDVFFTSKQLNSQQAAAVAVSSIKPGSIISLKLKANVDPIQYEQGQTDKKPAVDKQPGLKVLPVPVETGEKEIVIAIENLLLTLKKANLATVYVEDFAASSKLPRRIQTTRHETQTVPSVLTGYVALIFEQIESLFSIRTAHAAEAVTDHAQEIKVISTIEPALSFTFGGLANEAVVNDILDRLHRLGIKATFFVAEVEMQRYPGTLRKIIGHGHEIGIAIRPKEGETAEETRDIILRCRKNLQEQFGVAANLVKQPWGTVTDSAKEAVAATGCKLIGQAVNIVQSKHKDYTSADQVMAEIFGKSVFSLARGQIIHFRMDYYTNDSLLGALLEAVKLQKVDNIAYATAFDNPVNNPKNRSQYVIKPVGEVLSHTQLLYQYPVDLAKVPARLRQDSGIKVGQHDFLNELSHRYIGNADVTYEDRMLGFSKMEARRLDTSGLIRTKENVIFLTFDDWGTDAAINKILYVLRKHQVSGTFFILTNHVLNNPNLLRAITMEGHEIGSHSDKHNPMVMRDNQTGKQVATQNQEEYTQELATSYQKLLSVAGDVTVNGKPALTRFFRPPTLAISKMGAEALFETGYEYIISGSCSTYDYKAASVPQLVRTMKAGIYTKTGEVQKGAVLVMHMGDAVVYTPLALDILLTANEAKPDSDPSKFKVGRLSDYLADGYSQMQGKNP